MERTNVYDNNTVNLAGQVQGNLEFSHEVYGEKFYQFDLSIPRLSGASDIIPIVISEKILDGVENGKFVKIGGQIRTYNKEDGDKRHLLVNVFTRTVDVLDEEEYKTIKNPNEVIIKGFVCKQPTYRTTPLGREITDLLIAVNRAFGKSDYIPAIVWGRNAKYSSKLEVSTLVEISGRIQSRNYVKKTETEEVSRVAYELSVNSIKTIKAEEVKEEIQEA